MSGNSSQKTVVRPAEPSPTEKRLTKLQRKIGEQQLEAIKEARSFIASQFPELEAAALDLEQLAQDEIARGQDLQSLQDELFQSELERIRAGGVATDEDRRLIDEAVQAALDRAEIDIDRSQRASLETLREELAPALGLRPGDTPILDRGARVSAEALRQRGAISETLRGEQARALLEFPLQRSSVLSGQAQAQQDRAQVVQDFVSQLNEQAFLNRLELGKTEGSLRLGLATGVNAGLPQTISALAAIRGGTTTTTLNDPTAALRLGIQGIGAAGGLLTGLGSVGSAGGFSALSTKAAKTDDGPPQRVLDRVKRLPVRTWRYHEGLGMGDDLHIGPYAEDWRDTIGLGDGNTINLVDAAGVNLQATKELADEVDDIIDLLADEAGVYRLEKAAA